ncbi:MAG: murein hydrolase activator EnvC family protein [Coriobacteriia bacterium]
MWRFIVALSIVSLLLVVTGQSAWAAEWSLPVSGAAISLRFGAEYPGGVHRGIDLSADAGAEVQAPAAGRVAFAGTVPADGGGTCNAVTIETADGHKISLLPLESVHVRAGASVCAGDMVGRLSASGDDSTGSPHLHLSLRQGDRYIDPAPMLSVGGGAEPVMPPVLDTAPEPPVDSTAPALPDSGSVTSGELPRTPISGSLPGNAVASGSACESPEPATAPQSTPADSGVSLQAGTGVAPSHAGDAVRAVPEAARATHLVRDAGVRVYGMTDLNNVQTGGTPGNTTWISKRTHGMFEPAVQTPAAALVALAAAAGAVMPIIARSKALVRAR